MDRWFLGMGNASGLQFMYRYILLEVNWSSDTENLYKIFLYRNVTLLHSDWILMIASGLSLSSRLSTFSPVVKDVLMRKGFQEMGFKKGLPLDPKMRSDLKSYGTEWIKTEIWDKTVPLLVCKSRSDTRQCWNCHYLTVYNILLSYDGRYVLKHGTLN